MTPKTAILEGPRPESATLLQIKHWKEEARINKSRQSHRGNSQGAEKKIIHSSPASPKQEDIQEEKVDADQNSVIVKELKKAVRKKRKGRQGKRQLHDHEFTF